MFLHEERVRPRWMHRDAMNTVADLGDGIRHVLRMQTAIDWLPHLTAVVGPERACCRNSDENSLSIFRIEKNGVQTDRKSTCLNSSHVKISYAVFCLKKKKSRRVGRSARRKGQPADHGGGEPGRGAGWRCSRGVRSMIERPAPGERLGDMLGPLKYVF